MPNPMPFILALATLTLIPSLAFAEEEDDALTKPAAERVSLGLRLGAVNSVLGVGGLGGLLSFIYNPESTITFGIPLGESGWRLEPSVSGSYSTSENGSASTVHLGLMPQRVIASNTHGAFYAGAALGFSRFNTTSMLPGNPETSNTSMSGSIQPLVGVQGMLGDALSVGFEAGPTLNYIPSQSTELGSGSVESPSSININTNANLTIKYYFH